MRKMIPRLLVALVVILVIVSYPSEKEPVSTYPCRGATAKYLSNVYCSHAWTEVTCSDGSKFVFPGVQSVPSECTMELWQSITGKRMWKIRPAPRRKPLEKKP